MGAEARPPEARKTVTVVFSDVAESTRLGSQLDAEATRRVMGRYFEAASRVLERHGGSVEKFIGDAVMAVFGIPSVHEDDALRAVRAVTELHAAVDDLNGQLENEHGVRIALRTGVNTGEVVTGGAPGGHTLVTGDAVNVAARLEQTAEPGEILIGDATRRLVGNAVRVEELGPLTIRGKQDGVVSWRLLEVLEGVPGFARRLDSRLIGRERELEQLRHAFAFATHERTPYLFTVLGAAGIGKSRLAAEFVALSNEPRVLTGRCLPYGDGITFWPLLEICNELTAASEDLRGAIASRLPPTEPAERIADGIAALFGRSDHPVSTEESSWAVRKLFEALARERPLVVMFEDIHWGEPGLFDLIDYVVDWSRDAPMLVLCLARPELLEKRGGWAGGKLNATSILIGPLSDSDSNTLIDELVGEMELSHSARSRIAEAAEGNPLFVEQMLAMAEEGTPGAELDVPPTIQALLAARLDRLDSGDRAAIERAAVIGKRFWTRAVSDLTPEGERLEVAARLRELVRKELIRPDRAVVAGEDGYVFRHHLIRDAAYAGIPKEVRAGLHERFVEWIEAHAAERIVEVEELVGYHLEQAFRFRRELGAADERTRALAARASQRLDAAGRRALARGDASAATSLLGRATSLAAVDAPARASLLVDLGGALVIAGEFARADAVLTEAVDAAGAAGDRQVELHALLERSFLRALTNPRAGGDELRRTVEQALPELERLGDNLGLAKAWRRIADVHWLQNHWGEQEEALQRAILHAQREGDAREAAVALMRLPMAFYYGPLAVPEARMRAEQVLGQAEGARMVQANALVCLAGLEAMSGRFDEARVVLARGRGIAEELGFRVWLGGFALIAGDIELLAGDPAAAARELRRGYSILEAIGERGLLARLAAALAHALLEHGDDAEAGHFTEVSERLGSADVASQISSRAARAKLVARSGQLEAAEALAREAVELAETTDDVNQQGQALVDLAHVLAQAGRRDDAGVVAARAAVLFERKGNVVSAEASRALSARG